MDWFLVPAASYFYLCRYSMRQVKWHIGVAYLLAHTILLGPEAQYQVTGIASLFQELLPLTIFGVMLLHRNPAWTLTTAILITAVFRLCGGTAQLIFYWAATAIGYRFEVFFLYADTAQQAVKLVLAICLLYCIDKKFRQSLDSLRWPVMLIFAVPAFYISLVECAVRDTVYGNTIVWDSNLGIVSPEVNHVEVLLLQLFGCISLFITLIAYQSVIKSIQTRQAAAHLEQQIHGQAVYVQEARLRYEQTKAFRHDIQNHFTVLSQLLRSGQTGKALEYLDDLDCLPASLSYPVQTGNAAIDALLVSKLAIARQKGIPVKSALKIPENSRIPDMDWCVMLANALDNAIQASGDIPTERRYIHIAGKRKGNFYLLSITNGCMETLRELKEGIGLANIRATAGKHQGAVSLEVGEGVCRVDILLVISQQEDCLSQQTSCD